MLNLCIVRVWITYLSAFLLTLSAWSVSAQSSGWDASLDRYESICNQCIDLRQRSLAGESVSSASITDLLGQLASLRRALQASAGQMTPSQRPLREHPPSLLRGVLLSLSGPFIFIPPRPSTIIRTPFHDASRPCVERQ